MKAAWISRSSRRWTVRTGAFGLGAVGAVGLAVFLGAGHGYPVQDVRLLPGSAWLASSQAGQLTLLDGASAEVAAQAQAAPAGHVLDVVQQGSTAYAIDETAGTLRRVDGATFTLTAPATPIPGAKAGLTAFADPRNVYALDTQRGLLTTADPHTLAPTGAPLSLAAQLSTGAATLDDAGRLWLVDDSTGDLTRVADGRSQVHRGVAQPGKDLLALVNGKPVVVDAAGRKAVPVDPDDGSPSGSLNLDLRPTDTIAVSGSPHANRLYVVASRGVLEICDLAARTCTDTVPLDSNGNELGAAVETGDRVFVPDYTTGQVWVIDLTRHTVVATAQVLGPSTRFQLLTRDGIVFFNDPNSEKAGVVSLDGAVTQVAKYDPADPTKGLTGHQPSSSAPSAPQSAPSSKPSQGPSSSAPSTPPSKSQPSTAPPSSQPSQSLPGRSRTGNPPQPTPTANPSSNRPPSTPPSIPVPSPSSVVPPPSTPSPSPSPSPTPTPTPPPALTITMSQRSAMVGQAVSFQVKNTNGAQPTTAHWTFGDGGTADGLTASHTWTTKGSYVISATATMPGGAVQPPVSVTLTVTPIPQVTLTVSVPGGGKVTGGGINCPGACSTTVDKGTAITLTETPGPYYNFAGWGGACTGGATTCALTLNADKQASVAYTDTAAPEDCIPYNPGSLFLINNDAAGYTLAADLGGGSSMLMAKLADLQDANNALSVARGFNQQCFIGRSGEPKNYIMQYWKGGAGQAGPVTNEDCLSYDPSNLTLVRVDDPGGPWWSLRDGGSYLEAFKAQANGVLALRVLQQRSQQCFLGRDNTMSDHYGYIFDYFR